MVKEFSDFPEPEILGHSWVAIDTPPRCEKVEFSPSRHTASTSCRFSTLTL
jgi:hypothetical protein